MHILTLELFTVAAISQNYKLLIWKPLTLLMIWLSSNLMTLVLLLDNKGYVSFPWDNKGCVLIPWNTKVLLFSPWKNKSYIFLRDNKDNFDGVNFHGVKSTIDYSHNFTRTAYKLHGLWFLCDKKGYTYLHGIIRATYELYDITRAHILFLWHDKGYIIISMR